MSLRSRFGTVRGVVRLALSYPQLVLLPTASRNPDRAEIRRLVFVCHGNICRSAYAEVVARSLRVDAASFGLSTYAGGPAHPPAMEAARMLGHDMSAHRTTRVEDFDPHPGDLLLAMEVRQLDRLAADPRLGRSSRSLLGLWAQPPMPHLHDPFGLDDAYMVTCLKRIGVAVARLKDAFPGAGL